MGKPDLSKLSDITSTASSSLSPLLTSLSSPSLSAPSTIVAGLNLYPDMSLLPRWPGFDEDEQLAGPEPGDNDPAVQSGGGMKKVWSHEEMAKMSLKQLGRLKASGVEVGDLLGRRRKEQRTKASYELDTKEKGDTVEVVRDDNA